MTAVIVAGIGFISGGVLFNPGPLNAKAGTSLGGVTSHADLSNNCSSCHTAFWGQVRMADRCVVCHVDITTQWGDPATLHGNLHKSKPNLVCRNCHPEHRGPNASINRNDPGGCHPRHFWICPYRACDQDGWEHLRVRGLSHEWVYPF